MKRVIVIVMDGCGVGPLPDAASYGDADVSSATLPHVALAVGGLRLPTLEALGLGAIVPIDGLSAGGSIRGAYGKMAEQSAGKDSVTGHWEMTGIVTENPFPTYPHGFPADVIAALESAIGSSVLGNMAASGTEIIARLGEEHVHTGKPIVYTSADSVFQVAAHEAVIPIERLYEICLIARRLLIVPNNVQRVIARPFLGESASTYHRTEHRRDFPLAPPTPNLLTALKSAGKSTHAIGVIADLFPAEYFRLSERTQKNREHLRAIQLAIEEPECEFIFANCEDFDMLYGHRNDPQGFALALVDFDVALGQILPMLGDDDLLLITADHGNDPTTISTDHSREYVPLLACGASIVGGTNLGTRTTFADIAATVAAHLDLPWKGPGRDVNVSRNRP